PLDQGPRFNVSLTWDEALAGHQSGIQKQVPGYGFHGLAQALNIRNDVAVGYIASALVIEKTFYRVRRHTDALCDRGECSSQIVKAEGHPGGLNDFGDLALRFHEITRRAFSGENKSIPGAFL